MSDGLNEAAQTAAEHVAASAAQPERAAKARPSRPAALEPATPEGVCANCETELQGPVCHNCGQLADIYHRPVRGLIGELVEGLFALDGRVARTIPNLLGRPGRITRDYLQGKRARYMPPFRLYIIASLIFFFLVPGLDQVADGIGSGQADYSGAAVEGAPWRDGFGSRIDAELQTSVEDGDMTPEEAAEAREALAVIGFQGLRGEDEQAGQDAGVPAEPASEPAPDAAGDGGEPSVSQGGAEQGAPSGVELASGRGSALVFGADSDPDDIRRLFTPEDFGRPAPETVFPLSMRRYLGERFAAVAEDPGGWVDAAADWVPRIMFVMVPVYALLLSLTYAWRRRYFYFDHLTVSLHFHSAIFLAMSAALLIGGGWAFIALLLYSNIYLYRLQRVVYARGRITSVLRTLTLDMLYLFVLIFGFVAVLLLGALAG